MIQKNINILDEIFNFIPVYEISEEEMQKLANHMNITLPNNFLLKCSWSYYKKCTIFSLEKEPLIFFKYIRENYFQEILGLYLTKFFFDGELCFRNFLTGLYQEKKKPIPYIATIYEEGEDIGNKKYNIYDFKYNLGRQCYLHEILSLYDVFDRHFIVRKDRSVCRIDFGRCFENLEKKYLGFHDYLKQNHLEFSDNEFQKGYKMEKKIIKENLSNVRSELKDLLLKIRDLKEDYELIHFEPQKFISNLINHWKTINFLSDTEISDYVLL